MAQYVRKYVYIFKLYVGIAAQWSILSYIDLFGMILLKLQLFFILVVLLGESTYLCSFELKNIGSFDIFKNIMLKHFTM